jgi:hypothetical protein
MRVARRSSASVSSIESTGVDQLAIDAKKAFDAV